MTLSKILVIAVLVFASAAHDATAADIKVMGDGPLRPMLLNIGEMYQRERGRTVEFVFGISPVIHKRIADGEAADALIIQPNFIAELIKAGKVAPGNHPVIARFAIGIAVRAGMPNRDVSTPQKLKEALLAADSIIFNNVATGNYFSSVLDKLGIAEATKTKVVRVVPAETFSRIMQGKGTDMGVGTVPQIMAEKGLKLLGPLPGELQSPLLYAAAPMTGAKSPELAKEFIQYLSSSRAKEQFAAAGVN